MRNQLAIALLLGLSAGVGAQENVKRPPLPPDLAAVPADAFGFVHIRMADIWKSDALKELRDTVMQAGEQALGGFDKRFVPTPSSIERLTVVLVPDPEDFNRDPGVYAVLAVNKPFDKDELLKSAMPGAVEKKTTNGSYYVTPTNQLAVAFAPDSLIFGNAKGVALYVDKKSSGAGPLTDALHAANSKRHITVGANLTMIPQKEIERAMSEIPPPFRPLILVRTATLSFDLADTARLDLSADYADDAAAKAALVALQDAAKLGRAELKKGREEMLNTVLGDGKLAPLEKLPESAMALVALGGIKRLDDFLANPPVKQDGRSVRASLNVPNISYAALVPVGIGLMLPAVQKVREAAGRSQSMNNLKQIGIAMFNYESTMGHFPPAAICDKNGKPLLSWRVAILPYIEQENLYKQFKLDEPWDSDHNKKLIAKMPRTYMSPTAPKEDQPLCRYRVFVGKDAMFGLNDKRGFAQVTDGLSNTIMIVEADEGGPWTKPEDFEYDAKKPLPKLGGLYDNGFNVLLGDGSARFISKPIKEETLRALITANGGETVEVP